MTHDEYQVERMQPPEMPPCRCGHAPHVGMCDEIDDEEMARCVCPNYQPADAEELRQHEHGETI